MNAEWINEWINKSQGKCSRYNGSVTVYRWRIKIMKKVSANENFTLAGQHWVITKGGFDKNRFTNTRKPQSKADTLGSSLVVQWVKDLVLPQLWHRLQLQHGFDPQPRNFHVPQYSQKKKKKKKNFTVGKSGSGAWEINGTIFKNKYIKINMNLNFPKTSLII